MSIASAANEGQAPPNTQPGGPMGGNGMSGMIQNLTEQGFDMTKIQVALDNGDNETVKSLLDEFYTGHPETKPQRPPMSAEDIQEIISNLSAQGQDVGGIQAALDGSDTTSAQSLLDKFWEEHPDSRPIPPQGEVPPGEQSPR